MWRQACSDIMLTAMRWPRRLSETTPVVTWVKASAAQRHLSYGQRQAALPRQPVPVLQQTLHKYLVSLQALLSEQDYRRNVQLVEEFGKPGGIGEKLQTKLQEKAKKTNNWLADWWQNVAYLEYRSPSPIYVNPAIMLPGEVFNNNKDFLRFVTRFVLGLLDYKKLLDEDKLAGEIFRDDILCMNQYHHVFNTCRTPHPKRDGIATYKDGGQHIVVLCNNNLFSVPVTNDKGHSLPADVISSQLEQIVAQSDKAGIPVSVLTSDHRDNWTQAYKELVADDGNKKIIEQIQRSAFIVCLDNPVQFRSDRFSALLNNIHHGISTAHNSGNRWFDKTLQIVATRDGLLGANYEHSTAEAGPVVAMLDHAMSFSKTNNFDVIDSMSQGKAVSPTRLNFHISPKLQEAIAESGTRFNKLINDLELYGWTFSHFGKDFIKTQKLSPDAFVQIALQLAYFRLHGKVTATYETGSLRRFIYGRTETIRSCSVASRDYCHAMASERTSFSERVALLRRAIDSHSKYTEEVLAGRGIDRHLLGLKLIAVESGEAMPELFKDAAFSDSCHWRLSTSQISSQFRSVAGFGPVEQDGYGVCYNLMGDTINFSTSAWRSCSETDANKMRHHIAQSLLDGHDLLLLTHSAHL